MSHWQACKLSLTCSMAVLKRALINIMPEWQSSIQEDANANLEAKNYYGHGTKKGYKLVIPVRSGDIGFKQNADGTWEADYDSMSIPGPMRRGGGIETALKGELAAMKAKAVAQVNGYQVISDNIQGNTRIIRTLVPIGQKA